MKRIGITPTNRTTETGGKIYEVEDFFTFSIEPEDYENREITMIGKYEDLVKVDPIITHNVITFLVKEGLLSSKGNNRAEFIESLSRMPRSERRKAIKAYEKKHKGKFDYINPAFLSAAPLS